MSGYLTPEETRILALNALRLREDRNWSQEDLARISGLHTSTIRKLGRRLHSAQDGTLKRLATAFNVTDPDELLVPWDPLPLAADPALTAEPPPPVSAARTAFNQQLEELKRLAARVARDDAEHGERLYILMTGRVRQMTQAVQAERRRRP